MVSDVVNKIVNVKKLDDNGLRYVSTNYIEFVSSDEERRRRQIEMREAKIESIVDNNNSKLEEINKDVDFNPFNNGSNTYDTISTVIKQKNIQLNPIVGNEDFDKIVLTQYYNMTLKIAQLESYSISSEFTDNGYKKLLSKLIMCSNKIAVESRVGLANFCIMSPSIYQRIWSDIQKSYFMKGVTFIMSGVIPDDRIILGVKPNHTYKSGLCLFYNSNYWALEQIGSINMIGWIELR